MKVCLIGYYDEGQYSLRCLETTLHEAGHEVDLVVMKSLWHMFIPPTEKEYELLAGLARDLKPDLIGVTVRSPFVWLAKDITEWLRGIAPIVWGGLHTTVAPEYSIKRPDMILRGEADRTLPMLADALSRGNDLSEIPGLWWKKDGEIHQNPLGPLIEDLDSLPFPLFRKEHRWFIENNKLIQDDPWFCSQNRYYPMMASRGCPQKCTYCSNAAIMKLFGRAGKIIRLRNPMRVVEELQRFINTFGEVKGVDFMDEVFGYKPSWVEEFCSVWKKESMPQFIAEIHPSLVKEDLIVKLKDAGLSFLNMGIQSGSERVRTEIYDRFSTNKEILQATQILHRHGIRYRVEFIVGNPLERAEDLKESLDLKLQLPRPYSPMSFQLMHLPGTPLTERLLSEKKITNEEVIGYTEQNTTILGPRVDLKDGHPADYYFYLCLNLITDFLYWNQDYTSGFGNNRLFYSPWFIRLLERISWLKHNPEKMLILTDRLGKFAHWSWFWTSYFPEKFGNKTKNAWNMTKAGDIAGLKNGLVKLGRRAARQLGFSSRTIAPEQDVECKKP